MKIRWIKWIPHLVLGSTCAVYPGEILAQITGVSGSVVQTPSKNQNVAKAGDPKKNPALAAMSYDELLGFFRRVIQLVQAEHIDEVDPATLVEYGLKGMLSALDPHSCYLDQAEYDRLKDSISGSFGGIGVVMANDQRSGGMRVISCLDGTPADKAGILSGDMIIAVDDKLFSQSDGFFSMSDMMRGDPGTTVKVSIERKGHSEILNFFIVRSIISVQSVKFHVEGNIGIIRIANFDEKTPQLLKKAIENIQLQTKNNLLGYIVDLRRNSGGLVEQAIACCQLFIDKGVLLRARGRSGTEEEINYAIPGLAIVKNTPIVVLIDQGTASAAEMMAGAMQDHKVAVILGTQSFGKGSTQIILPVDARVGSAVKITGKRWYTPNGHPIQAQGITPDIMAEQVKAMEPLFSQNDFVMRESLFMNALTSEQKVSDSVATPVTATEKKTTAPVVKNPTPVKENNGGGDLKEPLQKNTEKNSPADPQPESNSVPESKAGEMDANDGYSKPFDYQMDCAKKLITGLSIFSKQKK